MSVHGNKNWSPPTQVTQKVNLVTFWVPSSGSGCRIPVQSSGVGFLLGGQDPENICVSMGASLPAQLGGGLQWWETVSPPSRGLPGRGGQGTVRICPTAFLG